MAGCCECGNEPSGSLKYEEFFSLAEGLLVSQEGPRCMALYLCLVDETNRLSRNVGQKLSIDAMPHLRTETTYIYFNTKA